MKSKKIRNSARGEDCSLRVHPQCQDGETVVLAHINTNYKGVGIKSPDLFSCYACYWCHHEMLDKGLVSHQDQLRSMIETQKKFLDKGLIEVVK